MKLGKTIFFNLHARMQNVKMRNAKCKGHSDFEAVNSTSTSTSTLVWSDFIIRSKDPSDIIKATRVTDSETGESCAFSPHPISLGLNRVFNNCRVMSDE